MLLVIHGYWIAVGEALTMRGIVSDMTTRCDLGTWFFVYLEVTGGFGIDKLCNKEEHEVERINWFRREEASFVALRNRPTFPSSPQKLGKLGTTRPRLILDVTSSRPSSLLPFI